MRRASIIAGQRKTSSGDSGGAVRFELPMLHNRANASDPRWKTWAVLPSGAGDRDKEACRHFLEHQLRLPASWDGRNVFLGQAPPKQLSAGVLEQAPGFEFGQGLGDAHGHARQEWQEAHNPCCRLVMSLKPLFFSVLKLLGLRVRVGVEERRVLRHDPEQEMLLLGRHPPGPQQCCDVLGGIQSMHKRCLQKFDVFWIGPKVGCSGNDAPPPAFGRADSAFSLAPILPGSCVFRIQHFLGPLLGQGIAGRLFARALVCVRVPRAGMQGREAVKERPLLLSYSSMSGGMENCT